MKLSEAMMLGGIVNKVNSACWEGCLLGVSVQALGGDNSFNLEAERRWPWIINAVKTPDIFRKHYGTIGLATVRNILSNMATWVQSGEMTLESAVDWVRSVEPDEPAVAEVPVVEEVLTHQ